MRTSVPRAGTLKERRAALRRAVFPDSAARRRPKGGIPVCPCLDPGLRGHENRI
jgi:hypothetical protein